MATNKRYCETIPMFTARENERCELDGCHEPTYEGITEMMGVVIFSQETQTFENKENGDPFWIHANHYMVQDEVEEEEEELADEMEEEEEQLEDEMERPATENEKFWFWKAKYGLNYNEISGLPSVRLHIRPEHIDDEWLRAKQLLISNSLGEEVVAVGTTTMKDTTSRNSQLMRMKFYMNIDATQFDPAQIEDSIRLIYEEMEFVDLSIGLYEFRGRIPIVSFVYS